MIDPMKVLTYSVSFIVIVVMVPIIVISWLYGYFRKIIDL